MAPRLLSSANPAKYGKKINAANEVKKITIEINISKFPVATNFNRYFNFLETEN